MATESLSQCLDRDTGCEALLEYVYGLNALDREIFVVLSAHSEPLTVDEIAAEIDRERSTAYRSVQRLVDSDLVHKEQVNYDDGGYCHVFRPADGDEIADEMHRRLNDWYAQMGQLIGEFRETYDQSPEPLAAEQ